MSLRCTVTSTARPVTATARVAAAFGALTGLAVTASCSQILGIEALSEGDPPDAQVADAPGGLPDATPTPDAPGIDTSCVSASLTDALGTTPVDTDLADDTVAASCGGDGSPDQVFLWTAPTTDYYVFDTFGADFDTVLAFYDECGGEELTCNNNVGAVTQSEVVRKFDDGQQVILAVDGVSGNRGTGELHIERVSCPDVDLEGQSLPTEQSTLGFLDDHTSERCGGDGVEDRAYHWVAPEDGLYYFRAEAEGFRPILSLLEGPRCSDRELGCNIAFTGEQGAEVVRYLRAGETVGVLVDGVANAGLFTLDIGLSPAETCPEAELGSEPFSVPDFGPRVLAPSCSYARAVDGIGSPFEAGDLTYRMVLFGVGDTGSGYCDVIVTSPQEFALSALERGDCGGAELDCVLATQEGGNWTATLRLTLQAESVERTVVISERQAFDSGPIDVETACAAVAVR